MLQGWTLILTRLSRKCQLVIGVTRPKYEQMNVNVPSGRFLKGVAHAGSHSVEP